MPYGIHQPECKKIVVWAIGISLTLSLTVKELVPLYVEYTQKNIATSVEVVLLDGNFEPPQLVLFFPRHKFRRDQDNDLEKLTDCLYNSTNFSDCQVVKKLENVSWDVWNQDPSVQESAQYDRATFFNALSLAFFRKLLVNTSDVESALDEEKSDWNGAVLSSALNYFHWLGSTDFGIKPFLPEMTTVQDTDAYQSNIDLIFSHILNALCRRMSYTETDHGNEFEEPTVSNFTCTDLLHKAEAPIEMDATGLWIPLQRLKKPKIKQYRFAFQHRDPPEEQWAMDWKLQTDFNREILLYPSVDVLYASSIDTGFSSYVYQTPMGDRASGEVVTVRYAVQMRAKESRYNQQIYCHHRNTASRCLMECTKIWIIEKCGCAPFYYIKGMNYTKDVPYCSGSMYIKCNVTALPSDTWDYCTQKCKATCEYTAYSWQISHSRYELQDGNSSEFILRMIPTFDTFVEFAWTTKTTPEQFFSQIAGIVNFYLGISGLSLFILIIKCMDWSKRFKKLKGTQTGNGELPNGDQISAAVDRMAFGGTNEQREIENWILKLMSEMRNELKQDMEKSLDIRLRNMGTEGVKKETIFSNFRDES